MGDGLVDIALPSLQYEMEVTLIIRYFW